MGVPSPLLAPSASPLTRFGPLASEFPPLGALKEVAEDSPTGALRALKSNPSCTDTKDSNSTNSGDERDDHSESSTGPDCESLELRSNSSTSKTPAEAAAEVSQDTEAAQTKDSEKTPVASVSNAEFLETKGVFKTDTSELMPYGLPAEGSLVQLLCKVSHEGDSMRVEPCTGDDVHVDGELEIFWCSMHQHFHGAVVITPCTDAVACGIDLDANSQPLYSTDNVVGAPVRPAEGSYAPAWVYGAQWPYCAAPTTLILSSLPKDLSQEDLIEILDKEGFSSFYDFLHLPMDPELSGNLGYAIVNLTRHEYGLALSALLHGRSSWCGTSAPACQVTWSTKVQGVTQLIESYKDNAACHEDVPLEMRPTCFSSGWPCPLPLET